MDYYSVDNENDSPLIDSINKPQFFSFINSHSLKQDRLGNRNLNQLANKGFSHHKLQITILYVQIPCLFPKPRKMKKEEIYQSETNDAIFLKKPAE